MAKEVRVRFAPSPTGGLHIGGIRTALYNYLYARRQGGKFILRIEDTDQARKVDGAEEYILEALKWCGIEADESFQVGGPFGPYRQSERLTIYKKHINQLLADGHAYYAFDTPDELGAMRDRLQKEKADIQQYGVSTRMMMKNSLTLGDDKTQQLLTLGTPYAIRIKVPENQTVVVNDIVRGEVKVESKIIDDKILLKSDGYPTYHLANVVDDYLMKISHVIRGEEWLPSAPLHVLLYELFGWKNQMPEFAHLPLLLKPEGSGKLSKRDADRHGFPIFPIEWLDPKTDEKVLGFREQGYISEALVNFLAMLGWNPGNEDEVFNLDQMIEIFDIDRIHKSAAKFDIEKAKWYNQIYLKKQPRNLLATNFSKVVEDEGYTCSNEKALMIISLLIERATFFSDFWNLGSFFFVIPTEYDVHMARNKWSSEIGVFLSDFADKLSDNLFGEEEEIKQALREEADSHGLGIGKVMPALRLAMTGGGGGPDLMGILKVLGPEEVRSRIKLANEALN